MQFKEILLSDVLRFLTPLKIGAHHGASVHVYTGIAEFGKPGATFTLKQQIIEADYAYILWTAKTADNVYELGTDTFVVRDGRIVAQSFTSKMTPKS